MTKINKRLTVEDCVSIDGVYLEEFRDDINEWIKQYGPKTYFSIEPDRYDGEKLVVITEREETDEEYCERMRQNEVFKKSKEERERQEYERLKAKFGE